MEQPLVGGISETQTLRQSRRGLVETAPREGSDTHPSALEPLPGSTGGRGRSEDQAICAPREEAADQPPRPPQLRGSPRGRESATPTRRRAGQQRRPPPGSRRTAQPVHSGSCPLWKPRTQTQRMCGYLHSRRNA